VDAVRATGKPVVAILMNGRPLALEKALAGIAAVLETWFLGIESGPAIAAVLSGKASPGGRLPMTMPRVTGQLPMTYAHVPSGRPANADLAIDSARYRDVDVGPLFPFGHGLSYSRFSYGAFSIEERADVAVISIAVTNAGSVAADEVVQLYVRDPVASVARPVRELRGFHRLSLRAGETRTVRFTLTHAQLAIWKAGTWVIEPGVIDVLIGSSSADIRARGRLAISRQGEGTVPAASIATVSSVA
jgi:beta-glucosidase